MNLLMSRPVLSLLSCLLLTSGLACATPAEDAPASAPVAASSEPAPASATSTGPVTSASTLSARLADTVERTWRSDRYELYVPLHTWHNRRTYDADKIAEYNENPWGLGLGKYRYDEDGNWHALYAMAFLDSHNKVEPIAGYGYAKIWRPAQDWRLGLGFTAGVTMRQDYHYYPIPLVLPLLSVEYKRLAIQTTYVPGGRNNGNVLFTWARWQF